MSLVALLKTHLSHFTDYSFTVYRWMKDGGSRRRQLRMIDNLERYVIFILYSTKECLGEWFSVLD